MKRAKSTYWTRAVEASADPERAQRNWDLLKATGAVVDWALLIETALPKTKATARSPAGKSVKRSKAVPAAGSSGKTEPPGAADRALVLASLLSGSKALAGTLVSHPEWLTVLEPESLKFPRRKQGLDAEVGAWLPEKLRAKDYAGALRKLREFHARCILRLGARDLARFGNVVEITQELSSLADVCLESVYRICWQQMTERSGTPFHQDHAGNWRKTQFSVIGLGKLGGEELNYSSDVDVIFVYDEEGSVFREQPTKAARPVMTNHQFFNRFAEALIGEVSRLTPDGALYRIDLRLRPEGDSGPLSRSLGSYENYYAQWGQTWERMMLIKARAVAGDKSLAAEFIEMLQPFRYPRTLHEGVLREVAAVKDRIENEVVKTGELDRNVKLGRGGIREIEFIAQSQQLLLAGRQPFLQGPQTLPCLQKLAQYERLDRMVASALAAAYVFLRDVEHRLQMEENLQTHTIPTGKPAQERLARLMGFMTLREFEAARAKHCILVRGTFERMLKPDSGVPAKTATLPKEFDSHTEPEWKRWLEQHRFRDVEKAYRMLREFVEGPGYVHISPRTSELASQLLLRFFSMCPGGEALRSVVPRATFSASGRKSRGPAVPAEEPIARSASAPLSDPDRVLTRLDSFISAYGARSTLFELWNATPAIFELLVLLFDRSEFLAELAIRTPDLVDELVTSDRLRESKTAQQTLEDLRYGLKDADQHLWIRRYHQAELMRIGLRDILGLADFEQYLAELSALAEACLAYALEVVIQRHKLKAPPFAVIGLGKLGGAEIDYGSDLDVLFVADGKTKNLALLAKLAVELTDLLSTRTAQGAVFEVDARLRPDGEKGLLVNTLKAFEDYYRNRASLWEIQALSRTRLITGDPKCGAQFQNLAASLANFKSPSLPLSAATPDWKDTIHQMRLRIERERSPSGKGDLAIKTGAGGLMDAEFIAQAVAMEHGWHEPNTLRALEKAQQQRLLPDSDVLIANYRLLRRVEGILRRWSYEGETVLPDDPAPFYRVSVRCGYTTPEEFGAAVARFRRVIREAYNKVFGVKA